MMNCIYWVWCFRYTVMIYSKKLAILLFYKDPSHIQKEKLEGLQKIVLQN